MRRVTTVTERDVSRPVSDQSSVTIVTTPYGVSRYVTVIWANAQIVPMPPCPLSGGPRLGGMRSRCATYLAYAHGQGNASSSVGAINECVVKYRSTG